MAILHTGKWEGGISPTIPLPLERWGLLFLSSGRPSGTGPSFFVFFFFFFF